MELHVEGFVNHIAKYVTEHGHGPERGFLTAAGADELMAAVAKAQIPDMPPRPLMTDAEIAEWRASAARADSAKWRQWRTGWLETGYIGMLFGVPLYIREHQPEPLVFEGVKIPTAEELAARAAILAEVESMRRVTHV